ncbi:sigma-54-dependent transcriptional regulator [Plebeiibacterium sediminum]|uniref:Sigma-54 dependent transcriptional regulator n=1 Tax=Plebeiibacterium sediminum TaxID=2992112 RepID=A0AAE3M3T0_9BACT|nr:sigma-54 dependent transcriptional regulator [Plebeiobacterium sediminum]MCW3786614.1 sigma-54 dependent transcriptional regulator [Plebeiobacterium sediminum]
MNKRGNILIVDDNKSILSALEILLMKHYKIKCVSNPNLITSVFNENDFQLVLLDMNFKAGLNTGNEGLYWLNYIKEHHPETSVVMITAYGDVELAVNALKKGATDFILKPWDNAKLLATIESAMQLTISKQEVNSLKLKEKELKKAFNKEDKLIIGNSPQIMNVLNMVRKVAKTDTNVLITGENGTGKELIAREIHRLSKRHHEMMVSVDMGAITETLFESELFGHAKGAFTDAKEDRVGKFEVANNGTLFLDEIGNLSFPLQAKLLVALQSREITRLGSNKPIPINIRLVSATNKNLDQMVADSLFREDLLYRINTIQIEIPPLRDRGEDILVLADFFLKKYGHKYDKANLKINHKAQEKLLDYHWPGNIRELEHSIEKAVILSDSSVLKPDDFFLRPNGRTNTDPQSLKLEDMEQNLINQALDKNPGNVSAAADELGITRQTLYNKMKKFGIK